MVCYFFYLKKALKSHIEPIYFALLVWFTYHPVEGAKHKEKIKTDELGINEHVGLKILAKIKIYIHTRAELLFPLCYEIPCMLNVPSGTADISF